MDRSLAASLARGLVLVGWRPPVARPAGRSPRAPGHRRPLVVPRGAV